MFRVVYAKSEYCYSIPGRRAGHWRSRVREDHRVIEFGMTSPPTVPWLPHADDPRPWRQTVRGGVREDRMFSEVVTRRPPPIADQELRLPSGLIADLDECLRAITALDHAHAANLGPLGVLLLRTESVASSKIERVEASLDDYARALHGVKANESATSMVASTTALERLIRSVDSGQAIELRMITDAHQALMAEDASEHAYAGKLRDMQNWIGGSDHSPRGALYVPPPPETVEDYLADLLRFANRSDMSALAQAGIVHAQFESIHPFSDGNGRIGRALINTVLRRRGVTQRVVVPLASALVVRREEYFEALNAYRTGDAGPIVVAFTRSSEVAARESLVTAERMSDMPARWSELSGRPRRASAARRILDGLLAFPIFSTDEVAQRIGGATSSVYSAVSRLHEAGVIRPLTKRTRNQVWGAVDVLDELDDLSVRIGVAVRQDTSPWA
jgi:Fic family protein